jgi:indoleacetamide hydrolase
MSGHFSVNVASTSDASQWHGTAVKQLGAVADGSTCIEQLSNPFLRQLELHRELRAFISVDADALLRQARDHDAQFTHEHIKGPLSGLLRCVKDNIHVAGFANTAGTPALAGYRPVADAGVVATLRAAGALFVGKTNMHEFAFGITSVNAAFGAVANPRALGKFAGGSSGGTAAAIAAGLVTAGLGTDTGGSALIPAALCGIVGFRPTSGRYSSLGTTPVSRTRDTIGLMATSVSDVALLDDVITQQRPENPSLGTCTIRLGMCSYFFELMDHDLRSVFDQAIVRLKAAGVTFVDVEIPDISRLVEQSALPIALFEVGPELAKYLDTHGTGVDLASVARQIASPNVKAIFDSVYPNCAIAEQMYRDALRARAALTDAYRRVFTDHSLDAVVMPTTPLPAGAIEGSGDTVALNGMRVPTFPTFIRNTDPSTVAALPSLTIPAGLTGDGLPVGLMIDGAGGEDRHLLATGSRIERILDRPLSPSNVGVS